MDSSSLDDLTTKIKLHILPTLSTNIHAPRTVNCIILGSQFPHLLPEPSSRLNIYISRCIEADIDSITPWDYSRQSGTTPRMDLELRCSNCEISQSTQGSCPSYSVDYQGYASPSVISIGRASLFLLEADLCRRSHEIKAGNLWANIVMTKVSPDLNLGLPCPNCDALERICFA